MKVLYFHQHFSTPKGSAGIRSYAMAKQLLEEGNQVVMVCGSYGMGNTGLTMPFKFGLRRGNVEGIDVIEFELPYTNQTGFIKRAYLFLNFAVKSIRVAMSEDYDLLFATSTPLTAAIPGIVARWLRRKPFVFEVRDLWPELPRAMGVITNPVILFLLTVLEWAAYKSAHQLIALSPGIQQGIEKYRKDKSNIIMIPNGCDIDIFGKQETQTWYPDGVSPTDFNAVFTGTHGMANGLDAVINVAQVLKKKQREDIKLVLIGDGKLKPELQSAAKEKALTNIIFLPPVDKEKLSGLMKSADVGMQLLANVPAFYYGTSPNKFFDYLASGLPVLTNYPGWVADMINENKCGVSVVADNPEQFAQALITLADNKECLPEMAHAASRLAKERFDRKILSRQFVKFLESAENDQESV